MTVARCTCAGGWGTVTGHRLDCPAHARVAGLARGAQTEEELDRLGVEAERADVARDERRDERRRS